MSKIDPIYALIEALRRQGRLHCEVVSQDPWEVNNIAYYPNGQTQFQIPFKNGKLHGKVFLWHESGQLLREESFNKGQRHGLMRTWFIDGKPERQIDYTNGAYDGTRREWYPAGQMKLECAYRTNVLTGPFLQWHPNGHVKERGNYFDGQYHGLWKEYDEQGVLKVHHLYIRGTRLTGRTEQLLKSRQLTGKHIARMRNSALRRICLQEIGYEKFLLSMKPSVIDSHEDMDLLKIDWHPHEEPLYLVKVKCTTTGVFYTLRVPPNMKTVHQAIAWTFGMNEKNYHPEEES